MPDITPDISQKISHFRQIIREVGKEQAVLKLSKQYSREEIAFVMDQLNGRETAVLKFPFLIQREDLVYPPSYYLEQTSSERTASFKASLVSGELLIDMTGGFGVDAYFFSKVIAGTWYIEEDLAIYNIATANLKKLNPAINTIAGNSIEIIKNLPQKADWLYLDPIRRNKDRRLVRMEDYSPNLKEVSELLFTHAHNIMIKLSPMTDIIEAVKIFGDRVKHVYVLAIDNECKELLIVANEMPQHDILLESVNWSKDREERFVTSLNSRSREKVPLSEPLKFLYEPNAAIFKAQQYDEQANRYSLNKLHHNTHIYTSDLLIPFYEGKTYAVKGVSAFDANEFRMLTSGSSFNIKTRNFTMDPGEVAKKLGVREGGDEFLFCVRTSNGKLKLILCDRI